MPALHAFHGMITVAPAMLDLFRLVERAARTDVSVLVRGETGTGKELVARALHALSPRSTRPFRAVNCATLTGDLLASELFGHVRGAFTGAVRSREGLFETADGGTVFLDEIAELPLDIQPRLLRVLQEQRFTPVGGTEPRQVDVRIVAATHRALRREVARGRFRGDLMYRVRVAPLFIPPLRDRPGDVEALAFHFVETLSNAQRTLTDIDGVALDALVAYPWPGNVRELRNVIEAAVAMGEGNTLTLADLPPELRGEPPPSSPEPDDLESADRRRILAALSAAGGRRAEAATRLGMSRTTLWRRLRELGLSR